MNRRQFIDALEKALSRMPEAERKELIEDYETHFDIGLEKGKTEYEIAKELGNPTKLAEDVLGISPAQTNKFDVRSILVFIAVLIININFVIPFAFGVWGTWLGISIGGIVMTMAVPIYSLVGLIMQQFEWSYFFVAIGLTGLGLLMIAAMWAIGKFMWKWSKIYVIWNINLVKGRY